MSKKNVTIQMDENFKKALDYYVKEKFGMPTATYLRHLATKEVQKEIEDDTSLSKEMKRLKDGQKSLFE